MCAFSVQVNRKPFLAYGINIFTTYADFSVICLGRIFINVHTELRFLFIVNDFRQKVHRPYTYWSVDRCVSE